MARLGAGTRKRADGTLEKRFTIDGKRYSVYGKNAKEISQKEQEIRKKIETGIYTDSRNITLDGYFDEWLNGKRGSIKGNALTWSDIDYKQNVIHVTKTATFNEDNTRTTGTPKSESGKRDIPLNSSDDTGRKNLVFMRVAGMFRWFVATIWQHFKYHNDLTG